MPSSRPPARARKPAASEALRARKAPRQARSQATVALLLEAATRVLRTESLAGFNTNRVAEVAGVGIGSLYQYFPNKSALIAALVEQAQTALADAVEAQVAALEGASLEASLWSLATLAVHQQYADPVLAAALDHEERRLPLQDRIGPAEQRTLAALRTLLARHLPAVPPSAPRDCLVIAKALVEADAGSGRPPPPDLTARIVRALTGYLRATDPAPPKTIPP